MARMARVVAPGCWHHVTQRGNRRETIFVEDTDRTMYIRLLRRHCQKSRVRIAGYCLMTNHVHLIAIPERSGSLAQALGRTHNDYARWFNLRRGQTGHLWQSRFFSCPLDEHHQWEALRYVELNPVRAGVVSAALDWPWSSAQAHGGRKDRGGVLDLASWSVRWTIDSWRDALQEGVQDAAVAERIREATRTGRPAGDDKFITQMEALTGRQLRPHKRGPKALAPSLACGAPTEMGIW